MKVQRLVCGGSVTCLGLSVLLGGILGSLSGGGGFDIGVGLGRGFSGGGLVFVGLVGLGRSIGSLVGACGT